MTESEKLFPWQEGLPTKPDVDALLKAFPPEEIAPGAWQIDDDQVKSVLGRCDGNRYRTVTLAWRKRLKRDYRVILYRRELIGFYCPTAEEVFSRTHPTYEHVGRSIGKQAVDVGIVKPENDQQRTVQEHQGRLLHTTKKYLRKDRMNVLPSTAVNETPRIGPPSRKSGEGHNL